MKGRHLPISLFAMLFLLGAVFFHGCKPVEKIHADRIRPISAARLYKKALENSFDYESFSIKRAQIQVDNGKNRTSFRALLQAVKDQAILVSVTKLNLLVARVLLTPDSVVYVNYFDKSWFSGGYDDFSVITGIHFDFDIMQAVVSSDLFSLFDDSRRLREYSTRIEGGMYILEPVEAERIARFEERESHIFQTFSFDPELILIRKLKHEDKLIPRLTEIRFGDYQAIGKQMYPSSLDLEITSPGFFFSLSARMDGFSTEAGELLLLKIPEKFKRVSLN